MTNHKMLYLTHKTLNMTIAQHCIWSIDINIILNQTLWIFNQTFFPQNMATLVCFFPQYKTFYLVALDFFHCYGAKIFPKKKLKKLKPWKGECPKVSSQPTTIHGSPHPFSSCCCGWTSTKLMWGFTGQGEPQHPQQYLHLFERGLS